MNNIDVNEDFRKLNYENEFGSFNSDGSEYWIRQSKNKRIPVAWSNILTNDKFGTVVTDTMGGYTWYINSQTNRITPFENDAFMDKSFDNIIFKCEENEKEKNKEINMKNNTDFFYTCFGFGYAKYFNDFDDIQKEIDIFVPINDTAKIYIVKLENKGKYEKKLKIKYNIKWQLADSKEHSVVVETYKRNVNIIEAKNLMNDKYTAYICSSQKINKNKEIKINLKPNEKTQMLIALGVEEKEENIINSVTKIISNYNDEFEETKKYWKEQVCRIKANTPMQSFNTMQNGWLCYQTLASRIIAKTGFYQSSGGYGFRDQLQDAIGMKWVNPDILKNQILYNAAHQFYEGDVEHWWHEDSKLGIRARYSDDMLWLPYAVLEYIDFTGDYGILKEKVGFIYAEELKPWEIDRVDYYRKIEGKNINFAPYKNGITYGNNKKQEVHINTNNERKRSKLSGQSSENNNNNLKIINNEKIDKFSIFEHCIKAIKIASILGKHNIPLIKNGDWNDGMNKIGSNGKGESVWLGFFLYNILTRFIEIIDYAEKNSQIKNVSKDMSIAFEDTIYNQNYITLGERNNEKEKKKENVNIYKTKPTQIGEWDKIDYEKLKSEFNEKAGKIKKALNTICWDGRWYLRAFDDEGNKIGSNEGEECKIDSISQSFSVISNAGDNDKKIIAMQSLENYLIDDENNVVKLLTPPLEKNDLGYITSYARGMRENGGQYTHAAIWAMIAESILGRKKELMRMYTKINPIEHTTNIDKLLKYKVEPYVVAGDIYSEENLAGRGGWTWYTGSSAWLYEAQIRYILGIKIYHGKMEIHPCVPDEWEKFEVNFKWKNAEYIIKYRKIGKYSVNIFENKTILNNEKNNKKEEQTIKGNKIELKDMGNFEINVTY